MIIKSNIDFLNGIKTFHYVLKGPMTASKMALTFNNLDGTLLKRQIYSLNKNESNLQHYHLLSLGTLVERHCLGQGTKNELLSFANNLIERATKEQSSTETALICNIAYYTDDGVLVYSQDRALSIVDDLTKSVKDFMRSMGIGKNDAALSKASNFVAIDVKKGESVNGASVYVVDIENFADIYQSIDVLNIYFYAVGDLSDSLKAHITIRHADLKASTTLTIINTNYISTSTFVVAQMSMTDGSKFEKAQIFSEQVYIATQISKAKTFFHGDINNGLFNKTLFPRELNRQIVLNLTPQSNMMDGALVVDYSKVIYSSGIRFVIRDSHGGDITNMFEVLVNKKRNFDVFYSALEIQEKLISGDINGLVNILNVFKNRLADPNALGVLLPIFKELNSTTIKFIMENNIDLKKIMSFWWNIILAKSANYDVTKSYVAVSNKWIEFDTFFNTVSLAHHKLQLEPIELVLLYDADKIRQIGLFAVYITYPTVVGIDCFDREHSVNKNMLFINKHDKTKLYFSDNNFNKFKDTLFDEQMILEFSTV